MKKKYLKYVIIIFILLILTIISLAHFPHLFIKKNFQYKVFHLYSNQEIILDKDVKSCLDSVAHILEKSPLYYPEQEHHLYFVRGTFYERIIRLIGRENMAFAMQGNAQVYSAFPNFEKGIIHRNNNEIEIMDMIQVFSHEAVHNQMRMEYSTLGIPTTPHWINEGFCEYVAYIPIREKEDYQLRDLMHKIEGNNDYWIKTEYDAFSPRNYILDRIKMEYLIDIKKMDIHEIISDNKMNPNLIEQELKDYFSK